VFRRVIRVIEAELLRRCRIIVSDERCDEAASFESTKESRDHLPGDLRFRMGAAIVGVWVSDSRSKCRSSDQTARYLPTSRYRECC
jgi:hypothetical protein